MNLVERFFADLTAECIRGGSLGSVRELIESIQEYLPIAIRIRSVTCGELRANRS
jgi:hypothetical protein